MRPQTYFLVWTLIAPAVLFAGSVPAQEAMPEGWSQPCCYTLVRGSLDTIETVIEPSAFDTHPRSTKAPLPIRFDLRDVDGESYVSGVKSQQGGTCWAHGTMASLESNLLVTGYEWVKHRTNQESPSLEEYHLDWWNGFNQHNNDDLVPPTGSGLVVHNGGDYLVAAAYFARCEGAVDGFTVIGSGIPDYDHYNNPPVRADPSYIIYYPGDIEWLTAGPELVDIEVVKEALMDHGAVGTAISWSGQFVEYGARTTFYQPPDDDALPNHSVAIAGWDDTLTTQAPMPGAWLCKNSWGTWFGEGGYFWVSYYDKWSCQHPEMGAVSFNNVEIAEYTGVYYHDYHGWRDTKSDCSVAVSAFNAANRDLLNTVSFYTAKDNVHYTVRVYDAFEGGELSDELAVTTGFIEHTGFHTVDLSQTVRFVPGDDFYVCLELSGGGQAYDRTSEVPVLLGAKSDAVVGSSSAPGQSYYWDGSLWQDLYDFNSTANFCIKGLTQDISPIVASVSLGPAPLEVSFSAVWPETEVLACSWSFDNAVGSEEMNPTCEFAEPGLHNVRVDMVTAEGTFSCMHKGVVGVSADTLAVSSAAAGAGGRAQVDVYAHNYLPLTEIEVPFCWDGPLNVAYDSFSVAGCRTETFERAMLISYVPVWKMATVILQAETGVYLDPGDGPVLSLFFTVEGGDQGMASPVVLSEYARYAPGFVSLVGDYRPETVDGQVVVGCCTGCVGDANGEGGEEPTIGDIVTIIEAKFITGTCDGVIECVAEADANQSGGSYPACDDITIGDITILIDYLFVTGSDSMDLPECL